MSLLKPQVEPVLLYQGDDESELLDLRLRWEVAQQQADAQRGTPLRTGDESPGAAVEEARAAYEAKLREAADRALEVRVAPIGSSRFSALVGAHPSRKDEDGNTITEDAYFGVNVDTLPRALLLFRDERKRTIISPDLDAEELAEFIDEDCTAGHVDKLFTAAYGLNRSQGSDLPKGPGSSTNSPRSTVS